ncbi:MAG TPA: class I SAM-dependent methyltransferase [Xanthobacteraceae bacterium]|nr:class I SAM-dependent methyltransferase [Xanthobacteraceae bacterium]
MEDTAEEIHRGGHRAFVGGDGQYWNHVSELQFGFLVNEGLRPTDVFIDVACGSLRGGIRFIDYLEPARYLGIDKHIELVIYGVAAELGIDKFRQKRPRFVISDSFEFSKFGAAPAFGIAQSLFSHLTASDIVRCLANLRAVAAPGCRFFATHHCTDEAFANPTASHSHGYFAYTPAEMESFGRETGWQPHYIGAWNHPRQQHIIEYRNAA